MLLQQRAGTLDNPEQKVQPAALPDSLSGAKHPLAQQPADQPVKGAVEVVTGADGQVVKKPLNVLSPGDHTIQFDSGRQFLVHVPPSTTGDALVTGAGTGSDSKKLPAMFVFSGSGEPQWNIKDFAPESGMSRVADEDPKHPFVVVYPLPEKHPLGEYSTQPAFGWNSTGVLIDQPDRTKAGYDDIDYVKSIVGLMPQITNVDSTHENWGAVAFSQGGLFLNKVVSTIPNLFPSIDLVGTSMQEDFKYQIQPGNAKNVQIVELLADKTTLPMRGLFSQSLTYDKQLVERFFLHDLVIGKFHGKSVIEGTEPLAAIHNEDQNPRLENKLYTKQLRLGNSGYSVTRENLPTPAESKKKDFEIDYVPKDPSDNRRVVVYGLVKAQHSYPAPLYGPRTNATTKYTEFDASRRFASMFDEYNDKLAH